MKKLLIIPLSVAFALGMAGTSYAAPPDQSKASEHSQASEHSEQHAIEETPEEEKASTTEPQPFSNADENNTGANDTSEDNPYRSTRDGSPSENGTSPDSSNKPCAGCVGKADNKNPPGQAPNGSDPNAGYECDRNQGVGQSNPAHTGCASEEPEVPEEPPVNPEPPKKPEVKGEEKDKPEVSITEKPKPQVLGVQHEQPAALATTGDDLGFLAILGFAIVGMGAGLKRISRR